MAVLMDEGTDRHSYRCSESRVVLVVLTRTHLKVDSREHWFHLGSTLVADNRLEAYLTFL